MKASIYNQAGEKTGTVALPKEIFEVETNTDLIHQVVVAQMANRRKVVAHTKIRGEVSGGGKKPWRQKGTGRARHGSIRSPIWKGGGVTFGPRKEKIFKKRIPKKMRKKAMFMVLTAKAKNGLLIILDDLKYQKPKTKEVVKILRNFDLENKSVLVALSQQDKNTILSFRNIPNVAAIQAVDLNCLDLLSYKYLLMPKESIKKIKETFNLR